MSPNTQAQVLFEKKPIVLSLCQVFSTIGTAVVGTQLTTTIPPRANVLKAVQITASGSMLVVMFMLPKRIRSLRRTEYDSLPAMVSNSLALMLVLTSFVDEYAGILPQSRGLGLLLLFASCAQMFTSVQVPYVQGILFEEQEKWKPYT